MNRRTNVRGAHALLLAALLASGASAAAVTAALPQTSADQDVDTATLERFVADGTLPAPAPGSASQPAEALADAVELVQPSGAHVTAATAAADASGRLTVELETTPAQLAAAVAAVSGSGRHTVTSVSYGPGGGPASITVHAHLAGDR